MSKVAALVTASILTLSSGVVLADTANVTPVAPSAQDTNMLDKPQERNTMFDGVNLTEQQRQQMRDLMHQARKDLPHINVEQMETMHRLVTAENFDQKAVRAQAEVMAQEQVDRQVEMARIRNQMFNLLTPEQKNVLNQKHEQRMQQMQQQMAGLQPTSAQKPSSISTQ
ncbi:MAG: cell-envelope stress modulator CpxP [Ewingella americana]|uniref:Periplasmic protein CpxP n=1 Tax=Ewingella americana TaxID=41202 RepID=A0A2N0N9R0_9GAMM|nr:cell-envelope stress modulator CpxP [Ewingella americana]KAA8725563.1 periplasmic heavy metal sensor [Ewingella americana]MCI1680515.1 cell-envelope stress modulator CpxP [Ewingella americana]MCI1856365.1 cell-envelope stress modulator CpxP [Ewingella americana]MCI1863918.1 cell-envelope stress modulator CpxP [Ewingella americana]MCI2143044.1 cell-envelope stress modulator CpxP [Ewingella americana]